MNDANETKLNRLSIELLPDGKIKVDGPGVQILSERAETVGNLVRDTLFRWDREQKDAPPFKPSDPLSSGWARQALVRLRELKINPENEADALRLLESIPMNKHIDTIENARGEHREWFEKGEKVLGKMVAASVTVHPTFNRGAILMRLRAMGIEQKYEEQALTMCGLSGPEHFEQSIIMMAVNHPEWFRNAPIEWNAPIAEILGTAAPIPHKFDDVGICKNCTCPIDHADASLPCPGEKPNREPEPLPWIDRLNALTLQKNPDGDFVLTGPNAYKVIQLADAMTGDRLFEEFMAVVAQLMAEPEDEKVEFTPIPQRLENQAARLRHFQNHLPPRGRSKSWEVIDVVFVECIECKGYVSKWAGEQVPVCLPCIELKKLRGQKESAPTPEQNTLHAAFQLWLVEVDAVKMGDRYVTGAQDAASFFLKEVGKHLGQAAEEESQLNTHVIITNHVDGFRIRSGGYEATGVSPNELPEQTLHCAHALWVQSTPGEKLAQMSHRGGAIFTRRQMEALNPRRTTVLPEGKLGEVCQKCGWTNTGCLNLGEWGRPEWTCHGCIKREHDAHKGCKEYERNLFTTIRDARVGGPEMLVTFGAGRILMGIWRRATGERGVYFKVTETAHPIGKYVPLSKAENQQLGFLYFQIDNDAAALTLLQLFEDFRAGNYYSRSWREDIEHELTKAEGGAPEKQTLSAPYRISLLGEELARIREGNFTAEEIHRLCHNLDKTVTVQAFCEGCEKYQISLYGRSPITEMRELLKAEETRHREEARQLRTGLRHWQAFVAELSNLLKCGAIDTEVTAAVKEMTTLNTSRLKEILNCRASLNIAINSGEIAWGLIANAGGGDWEKESEEWRVAAVQWRDDFHARIKNLHARIKNLQPDEDALREYRKPAMDGFRKLMTDNWSPRINEMALEVLKHYGEQI